METIYSIPASIKIAALFFFILACSRTKFPLGFALLSAALAIALWFKMPPVAAASLTLSGAMSPLSLVLLLLVEMIMLFSGCLETSGRIARIVKTFKRIVNNPKVSLMVFPALIGLLPMPGGALFSAPMVEAASSGQQMSPGLKTNINYYFRHVWELWWPLYPGIILLLSLTGIDVVRIFLINLPISVFMILTGFFIFLRKLPIEKEPAKTTGSYTDLFKELLPLVLVFCTIPLYKIACVIFSGITGIPLNSSGIAPVCAGLLIGIVHVSVTEKLPARKVLALALNKKSLYMGLLILGIMAFKHTMEKSGAVAGLLSDLQHYAISPLGIIIILPFIAGMVFGIMIGMVGASFPLVLPLIQQGPGGFDAMFLTFLAYLAGFSGMMLSPLHLCLLLTKQHFNARFSAFYGRLVLAIILTVFFSTVYYLIIFRIS